MKKAFVTGITGQDGSYLADLLPPQWWNEPTKDHNIGLTYIVTLRSENFTFGTTNHGRQEAGSVEWFTRDSMPPPSEFGYSMDRGFRRAFEILEKK